MQRKQKYRLYSTICICWTQTAYAVLCQPHHTDTSWNENSVSVQWGWQKMAPRWRGGDELLNKVTIFVFFAYKKYSRSFIKLRLNHWWQMEYSDYVFHTFLGLDSIYLAVNGTVTSLPVFIQNILNCVPKTNEAFTGLERHGGNISPMPNVVLLVILSFNCAFLIRVVDCGYC